MTRQKTLTNTTASQAKTNVSDLKVWGNGDTFKLICKVSSQAEGWMKSTKAMEIPRSGCVIQVTTQNKDNVAEALTFVPGVVIFEAKGEDGVVIDRIIASITNGSFITVNDQKYIRL